VSRRSLWPLGLYGALAVILFGIPVLGHFGSRIIASDPIDSSQFMWFFAWWPHALLHGLNPFVTHAIFYPDGFNLTWSTAMPGPSIALAPVTLAFGPAVTWNVIQLCSPALSAWTMFLLARHLTGRIWPSIAAGYVFGFSPYMLIHLTGGPYLALVPLLPVFVLLVLRRVEGSIGRRRFVIAMTLGLAAQYLISSEVLATATLFGGVALVLAFALFAERRAALLDTIKWLAVSYALTVVLISPFLYFFFFGHQYPPGATAFSADLTSFVLPPPLVALNRQGPAFAGANTEGYLGLPLLLLICLFAWRQRRTRVALLLELSLLIAALLSLGSYLFVRGKPTSIPGPWQALAHLPVLRYAVPIRFTLFVIFPAALIVALWLGRPRQTGVAARVALALLAIAFIVPSVGSHAWDTHISDPPFFEHGAYRAYLNSSDHVLTVPVWGPNERWIADAKFPFPLTNGYAGNPFPASFTRFATYDTLLSGKLTADYAAQLRRFIAAKRVTAIVVEQGYPGPWQKLFGTLGVRPVKTGGVVLYRLRGGT
jgi:hypothetical protein